MRRLVYFLTIRVHGEERLQILSKLNMTVKARRMTITQAQIVMPLKKSSFESSTSILGFLKMS